VIVLAIDYGVERLVPSTFDAPDTLESWIDRLAELADNNQFLYRSFALLTLGVDQSCPTVSHAAHQPGRVSLAGAFLDAQTTSHGVRIQTNVLGHVLLEHEPKVLSATQAVDFGLESGAQALVIHSTE
jgi:hypothetical protein